MIHLLHTNNPCVHVITVHMHAYTVGSACIGGQFLQESLSLTQQLLAAVDEGDIAKVKRLIETPELSSVSGTNKVCLQLPI